MQLHQFLRLLQSGVAISLFDCAGIEIYKVTTKELLPSDFYDLNIIEIKAGRIYIFADPTKYLNGIHIAIEK